METRQLEIGRRAERGSPGVHLHYCPISGGSQSSPITSPWPLRARAGHAALPARSIPAALPLSRRRRCPRGPAGAALEAWSRAPSGAGSGHGAGWERRGVGCGYPPFSSWGSSPLRPLLSSPCRFQPGMLEELPLRLGLLSATQRGRAPRGRRSSVVALSVFSSKCFFMLPKRDARLRVRHVGAGEFGCCRCT